MARRKTIGALAVVVGVLVVALITVVRWPKDDKHLAEHLVGTWEAVDPDNAALHRRQEGVDIERVVFHADGRLTYILESKSQPNASKTEPWGWKIKEGRLMLRYAGEDSTQEWFRPIKFEVSETSLSVNRKGFPVKECARVSG